MTSRDVLRNTPVERAGASGVELVAIDRGIAGWPGLAAEFRRRGEVVVLDGDSDGLLQLSAALRGRSGIAALHVVSHGEPGAVRLGTAVLSTATLHHHRTALDDLAAALAPGADLLLYGCNTGQGAVGAEFLDEMAAATGANIAASRTLTGAAARGGDWELAAAVGAVRTAPLASPDFAGVLVTGYTTGSDIAVNTTTTNSQEYASVAKLANGGFVVTWTSNGQDGDGNGVYGQRFDATGAAVGSEFRINTYTTDSQQDCSVAGLSGGGFVVTWSSYSQDGSLYGIFGQRYDSNGVAAGSEFRVNTWTNHVQNTPAVTTLSDGGFLVTWQSINQDGDGTGVYAQRYDSTGAVVGSEFRVNTTNVGDQGSSSATELSGGGYVITWSAGNGQDGSGYGVFAQIYDSANATVGSEFQVNTYTAGDQLLDPGVGTPGPCIAALAGGGFVVTWGSDGQDGDQTGVYAQVFDSSGGTVGSEIAVNTTTTGGQQFPSVAALSDGGFVITWGSDNDYHSYGQMFTATGTAVGTEFMIDTTDDADYPAVAALADGDFVAAWMGGDTADNTGVYAKLFSNSAPTLSSSSPSDDGTAVAISSTPTLTFSETVAAGTGSITLYQSGGTAVETFNVATGTGDHSGTVSFSSSTVTIDPGSALAYQTGYYLTVDATAVEDGAGKAFAGISDATTLNFTTTTAPASSDDGGSTTTPTALDATAAYGTLSAAIGRTTMSADDKAEATSALSGFLATTSPVTVSTVTLTPSGSGAQTFTISGSGTANEAMIIDVSGLPPGCTLVFDNVEFAVIIGSMSITGGSGRNYVVGDSSSQSVVLGAEDDILAGGGGDDYVGSLGGNDRLYGDDGNDTVSGGADNDVLHGGTGNDHLDGGIGTDIAVFTGTRAMMTVGSGLVSGEGSDTLTNVELLAFTNGITLTNTQLAGTFDETLYLAQNADVAAAVASGQFASGAQHFALYGAAEGRNGNALFDTAWYLAQNPDIAAAVSAGVTTAWAHYESYGWKEGRDPSMYFDSNAYLSGNQDVASAGINPLDHFLTWGAAEGRLAQATATGVSWLL